MGKLMMSVVTAMRRCAHRIAAHYRWRRDEHRHGFPCQICGAKNFEDAGNKCRGHFDCPGDRMSKEVFKDA